MRFPKYKALGLVGVFNIRIRRFEFLDNPQDALITWGRSAAYNHQRISRIGNLPLDTSEVTGWRQHVLHEVNYFTNRISIYSNRWQKAYERCYLALRKLKGPQKMVSYNLWQIIAISESARLNNSATRDRTNSKYNSEPKSWKEAHDLNAWILRQKLPPIPSSSSRWDYAFASIVRDTFRGRRFAWEACKNQQFDNFKNQMGDSERRGGAEQKRVLELTMPFRA